MLHPDVYCHEYLAPSANRVRCFFPGLKRHVAGLPTTLNDPGQFEFACGFPTIHFARRAAVLAGFASWLCGFQVVPTTHRGWLFLCRARRSCSTAPIRWHRCLDRRVRSIKFRCVGRHRASVFPNIQFWCVQHPPNESLQHDCGHKHPNAAANPAKFARHCVALPDDRRLLLAKRRVLARLRRWQYAAQSFAFHRR